jgi:hypothetical protein
MEAHPAPSACFTEYLPAEQSSTSVMSEEPSNFVEYKKVRPTVVRSKEYNFFQAEGGFP